jgi:hypothetical protein
MYHFLVLLLWSIQLSCLGLLGISCFPGALEDVTWISFIVVYISFIAALVILVPIGIVFWWRRRLKNQAALPKNLPKNLPSRPKIRRYPKQVAIATCLVLFLTSLLLKTNLPQKIAFSLSRPAFDGRCLFYFSEIAT